MIRENQLKKEILKEKHLRIINIGIRVFVIFLLLILTGCSKDSISGDKFTSLMKDKDYSVVDISSGDSVKILAVGDYFQVYYNLFDSKKLAKKSLKEELSDYDKEIIDKRTTDNMVIYEVDKNNIYSVYVLKDSTYINITTIDNYKSDAIKILKYLDYY